AYFLSVNRNKETVTINLKSSDGKAIAQKLVERADVVVDNFLPAVRAKLITFNPKALHCSISGYDRGAAEENMPGYYLLAQAVSGLMAITGDGEGEPMKTGVAVSDL